MLLSARTIKRTVMLAAAVAMVGTPALAQDSSAPAILQIFDASWRTLDNRAPDMFMAGYGAVWVPPPGRADSGNFSVGYDVYDRFDLGSAGNPTLYGTETGLKTAITNMRRAGVATYTDLVLNHNGFSDLGTTGFLASGAYPGFTLTEPNAVDGDFHSRFEGGVLNGRLAGLIDINQTTNFRYVRNPVPNPVGPNGETLRNLPAGTTPHNGRLANVARESNRRFYPDRNQSPGRVLFNPTTGQGGITLYDFDPSNPMGGDPVEENAVGYLMRHAQWMVQVIGVDGFRLDATKHMPTWYLNDFYDLSVYRANPRKLLDGSTQHVFSFGENFDGSKAYLQTYIRKDINPNDPGRVGGNRDTKDFPLFFALRDNLTSNGLQNDWRNVINASQDSQDDGLANNGSQGVAFAQSHDDFGPDLSSVAHAYMLMRPGNAIVYFNAKEFGTNRDFPKDGRGDALGGLYGDQVVKLNTIRNTHGRGNFIARLTEKETMVYERDRSALVVLSNRTDAGYDSRTVQTGFASGTWLVELTGNASDNGADPFNDIPDAIQVGANGVVNLRALRNRAPGTNNFTGKGYLIYGLPTPVGTLSLTNVDSTLAGGTPTASTNGTTRLTSVDVIKSNSFDLRLNTDPYYVLGTFRDRNADGDNAVFSINGGRGINGAATDLNGNGVVDYRTPGSVVYGFEEFTTLKSPGYNNTSGAGQYVQTIDASKLPEGYNYIEVKAFRRRTDGGPAVYSSFRKVVYVDLLAPVSSVATFEPWDQANTSNRDLVVRSDDQTADKVHVFLNLPANVSDATIRSWISQGNRAGQIDRDLFKYGFFGVPSGNNVVTVYTEEITGTYNIQRISGVSVQGSRGRGLGDLNYDGAWTPADIAGPGAFEQVLYSRDAQFSPAADVDGDGRVTNQDLYSLEQLLTVGNASPAVLSETRNAVLRRGNVNLDGTTNAADIDFLYANFGSTSWQLDLNSNGFVGQGDVNTLVGIIFQTAFGDANLDGRVDKNDLNILRLNLNQPGGWAQGDFNGDGLVTSADLSWWQVNFTFPAISATFPSAGFDTWTAVPEPGTFGIVMICTGLLLRRRERRDHPCGRA